MLSPRTFSNSTAVVHDDGGWSTFDMSLIHPAHGLAFDTLPPTLSAAEKLLASMENTDDEDGDGEDDEDDRRGNHDDRDGDSEGMMSAEENEGYNSSNCNEDEYRMSGEEGAESSASDSSLETPMSSFSSSSSCLDTLSFTGGLPSSNGFPFPLSRSFSASKAAKGKGRARSLSNKSTELALTLAFSNMPMHSPSIQLERNSSCFFSPPDPLSLVREPSAVPLDSSLEERIYSNSSSSVDLPSAASSSAAAAVAAYATAADAATEDPARTPTNEGFGSYAMQAVGSSSSGMMRSYSCPAHTQAEYDALRKKWNAESACTRRASQSAAAPPRPSLGRRASSSATLSSYSAGGGNNTGIKSYLSTRRTRDEADLHTADPYHRSYDAEPSVTCDFSQRENLLSPAHKHNPFKRSKLSLISEENPSCLSPPSSRAAAAAATVFDTTLSSSTSSSSSSTATTASTTPTKHAPASPPKSPTRPGLNRFFTMPEFFVGDGSKTDDEDE